jgi:hypothetical protein
MHWNLMGISSCFHVAMCSRVAEDDQIAKLGEIPTLDLALGGDDGGVPALCAECADGYEKEASQVRAKADGTTLALTYFPGWPHANEPQTSHKVNPMDEILY